MWKKWEVEKFTLKVTAWNVSRKSVEVLPNNFTIFCIMKYDLWWWQFQNSPSHTMNNPKQVQLVYISCLKQKISTLEHGHYCQLNCVRNRPSEIVVYSRYACNYFIARETGTWWENKMKKAGQRAPAFSHRQANIVFQLFIHIRHQNPDGFWRNHRPSHLTGGSPWNPQKEEHLKAYQIINIILKFHVFYKNSWPFQHSKCLAVPFSRFFYYNAHTFI